MDLTVGRAAGSLEIEAADVGAFVAEPVFPLGSHHYLDGPSAVLDDPVSDLTRASLRHDCLLVMVYKLFVV
jgi:hypothetical protein